MCNLPSNAFERALPASHTVREVMGVGGAVVTFTGALAALGAAPASAAAAAKKRAYVVVLDGCRPEEIGGGSMPYVASLRAAGTHYPRATSNPVMETIPNHCMMMTGVRPSRSGVPANTFFDRAAGAVRTMDQPADLRATTVIEQLNAAGRKTGTVLSKEYLYGIFGTRASYQWKPGPIIPVSGHAPDVATIDAAITMVDSFDPDFMFVNLGDIDRFGHVDITGTTLHAARTLALLDTDAQVKRFITHLQDTGRWADSLVLFIADHSMDWSLPTQLISLQGKLDADPLLKGNVQIAGNGGADLLYWTGAAGDRTTAIAKMRAIALAQPGVLEAHDVAGTPSLKLGAEAGDVLVWCKAGWRFSDPNVLSNPIPGNHGHPATYPIPFFLSGGSPMVPKATTRSTLVSTIDVAPTVAKFFGVASPTGGWDGAARL